MGLFSKSDSTPPSSNNTTIIAHATKIEGKILVQGKLHIDGYVDGKIEIDNSLSIGKKGGAKGEIFAKKVIISGFFEGSIESDIVEILSGGKVVGKIVCEDLIIEQKGIFIGESLRKTESSSTSTDIKKVKKTEQKLEQDAK